MLIILHIFAVLIINRNRMNKIFNDNAIKILDRMIAKGYKVDGVEIKQIEEKTEEDRRLNNAINLWRMRTK